MSQILSIEHPLAPLWDSESKILILGSFPSVKTREQGFFYGHPRNRFWPMLSRVLEIEPPLSIENKDRIRETLLQNQIAMWDSIYSCTIRGSSDSSIKDVVPTDLLPIIEGSKIQHVFCNGQSSYKYYQKYADERIQLPVHLMPSTSPANAASSLDDLVEAWQEIRMYL